MIKAQDRADHLAKLGCDGDQGNIDLPVQTALSKFLLRLYTTICSNQRMDWTQTILLSLLLLLLLLLL